MGKMRYMLLGGSGLRVSELCLGTMTFGTEWGHMGNTKEESRKVFDRFVQAGGNFIDTANKYLEGSSEKFLGEFMEGRREKFVLATKYSLSMDPADPNASGNHRKNLVQSVDASLKRLRTDYIDILWVHAWDFTTPIEQVMRALDDIVRQGKVLHVGISDAPAWVISAANTYASERGLSPFISLQTQYSLIQRDSERELIPMCRHFNVGVTAWSPLGGGVLSGKYTSGQKKDEPKRYGKGTTMGASTLTDRNLKIAGEVDRVAKNIKRTPAQVAVRWVIQQGRIIPIIGARTLAQLDDNLGCLDFELSSEQMRRLDEVSRIELGFPHDFLSAGMAKSLLFGNNPDMIR